MMFWASLMWNCKYLSCGQSHFKPLKLRILVSGQVIFLEDKLIFPVACPMDKLGSFLILNTGLSGTNYPVCAFILVHTALDRATCPLVPDK